MKGERRREQLRMSRGQKVVKSRRHVAEVGRKDRVEDKEERRIPADSGFLSSENSEPKGETVAGSAMSSRVPKGIKSGAGVNLGPDGCPIGLQQVTLNPLSSGLALRRDRAKLPEEKIRNDLAVKQDRQKALDMLKSADLWQLYCTQDENGQTPLHLAIIHSFEEAALYLIKNATDLAQLNVKNDFSESPLYLAVVKSQASIVRRLILTGADPTLRDAHGNTALHVACKNGDLSCAKALTDPISAREKKFLLPGRNLPNLPQDLELTNYNKGQTCLHLAAIDDRIHIARLLVQLGANVKARELLEGRTALHLAIKYNSRSVYSFLIRECRSCLDTATYAGLTAYQIALKDGDYQVAGELIAHGAKPEPLPVTDSESSDEE